MPAHIDARIQGGGGGWLGHACPGPWAVRGRGFRITIFDNRTRGDHSKPRLERVVVAGE